MHANDGEGASKPSDSAGSVRDAPSPPVNATASSAQNILQAKKMKTCLQVIFVTLKLFQPAICQLLLNNLYQNPKFI